MGEPQVQSPVLNYLLNELTRQKILHQPRVIGDPEIRHALLEKRLKFHSRKPDTLVVNELGLAHAKSRIDVAVINGIVHGFEIKSAQDSLSRLAGQLEIYSQSLQKLTMVVAPRHLTRVLEIAPVWSGVLEVEVGPRGGINFRIVRVAQRNPLLDPFILAHLLWRNEVLEILTLQGVNRSALRVPRKKLYRMLVDQVSVSQLTAMIKSAMMRRTNWRDLPQQM